MDLIQGLLLITSIHLLAAASPGPDFVLVSQQTLSNGKQTGFMVSIGIALGLSVHIIYSALGLAAVIANSATALWAIKIIGGGYLIYLGVQGLSAKPVSNLDPIGKVSEQKVLKKYPRLRAIAKGFLCNALNPKAPIYFLALFTVVLSPNLPLLHLVIYGIWMMILQLLWFSIVVVLLSQPSVNEKFQRLGHWINRVLGGAMILIGLKVLISKIN
ncbi:LysE family translocator [Colwellia sp. MB02u-6]|uniref:LysE family translocator n=1 Tax=Colwellia sp. MB02u-6 TaxID=2759824 RepID=UPI0015F3949E|nr:LysE family translocator [Colwellia sp. MB02u-6]MBA6327938.1 LysE family translocator [Colwellia sp. MB02u-6]